jgi:hypothetical protein
MILLTDSAGLRRSAETGAIAIAGIGIGITATAGTTTGITATVVIGTGAMETMAGITTVISMS